MGHFVTKKFFGVCNRVVFFMWNVFINGFSTGFCCGLFYCRLCSIVNNNGCVGYEMYFMLWLRGWVVFLNYVLQASVCLI